MTGNEAAEIVEQHCLKAGHAVGSGPTAEPTVCVHCHKVAVYLRAKHRDEQPPVITTSVHFVIDPATGRIGAKLDEVEAIEAARKIKGLTVSWPVSGDYRNIPDPPEATDG